MKRLVFVAAVVLVLILALSGCVYNPQKEPTPRATTPAADNGSNNEGPAAVLPPATDAPPPGEYPKGDVSWISPGKVEISNFYPGARAEWPVTIYNAKDTFVTYEVKYRVPDYTSDGYIKAPDIVQDWVLVADPTPMLSPGEIKDVLIVIEMPEDAVSPAPKWEFWISVRDITQTGFVQTELCSRWFVMMR
jgi:hypothetical protein